MNRLHCQTWQTLFWCHALSLKQKLGMRLGNIAVDVLICFKFQGYLEPVFSIQSLINIWKDGGNHAHTGRRLDFPRGFTDFDGANLYHFYRFKTSFPKCWIKFHVGFGFARHFAAAVMDSGWRIGPLGVVSMVDGVHRPLICRVKPLKLYSA